MAEELVTIELEGRDEVAGAVRLSDFIAELNALKSSLSRTQQEITTDAKAVEYRIAGLSYASPYRITVGIGSTSPAHAQTPGRIVRRFTTSLRAISKGHRYAKQVDMDTLQSFKGLSSQLSKGVKSVKVYQPNRPEVKLDQSFARNLNALTAITYSELDEISGRLEQVNIHGRNQFHIYPQLGPKRVFCKAANTLRADIISNLGKRVRVEGKVYYRKDAAHPHEMDVKWITQVGFDKPPATLSSLFGIAPNATGGATPEDFIRKLRNDNW